MGACEARTYNSSTGTDQHRQAMDNRDLYGGRRQKEQQTALDTCKIEDNALGPWARTSPWTLKGSF